jgi:hypothetical protein
VSFPSSGLVLRAHPDTPTSGSGRHAHGSCCIHGAVPSTARDRAATGQIEEAASGQLLRAAEELGIDLSRPGRGSDEYDDREVALDRYRNRAGARDAGHFDAIRAPDDLWNPQVVEPVAGGWSVVEADTNDPVDAAALARLVRAARDS